MSMPAIAASQDTAACDLARKVCALESAAAYPDAAPSVLALETHFAWVFLAGERVVKVKRPVRFGFVDHSTLERRRHSCEEEVRLNRRTAPTL